MSAPLLPNLADCGTGKAQAWQDRWNRCSSAHLAAHGLGQGLGGSPGSQEQVQRPPWMILLQTAKKQPQRYATCINLPLEGYSAVGTIEKSPTDQQRPLALQGRDCGHRKHSTLVKRTGMQHINRVQILTTLQAALPALISRTKTRPDLKRCKYFNVLCMSPSCLHS